jgi:hypothetical protein
MKTARYLLEWLNNESTLWRALPLGDSADKALDQRDSGDSELAWLREEAAVKLMLGQPVASQGIIDAVAKGAFLRAFEASQHHDLAAQVSDDLRLLAEAAEVGYESPTLKAFWVAYSNGEFPEVVA